MAHSNLQESKLQDPQILTKGLYEVRRIKH